MVAQHLYSFSIDSMNDRKHYAGILGVSEYPSEAELKSAYRALSKKLHPDLNQETVIGRNFMLVNEAYQYLNARLHEEPPIEQTITETRKPPKEETVTETLKPPSEETVTETRKPAPKPPPVKNTPAPQQAQPVKSPRIPASPGGNKSLTGLAVFVVMAVGLMLSIRFISARDSFVTTPLEMNNWRNDSASHTATRAKLKRGKISSERDHTLIETQFFRVELPAGWSCIESAEQFSCSPTQGREVSKLVLSYEPNGLTDLPGLFQTRISKPITVKSPFEYGKYDSPKVEFVTEKAIGQTVWIKGLQMSQSLRGNYFLRAGSLSNSIWIELEVTGPRDKAAFGEILLDRTLKSIVTTSPQ